MHRGKLTRINCMDPEIPNQFGANSSLMHTDIPAFHFDEFLGDPTSLQPFASVREQNVHPSCLSSNSTSDEAEKQHVEVIDERKQRRMVSNRESARRSRVRKQRQVDELWSLMMWLKNENNNLVDKLNQVSECHDRIVQQNTHLKGEASDLRQKISSMQLLGPCNALINLEEFPAIADYFRVESLCESMSSCEDLLN